MKSIAAVFLFGLFAFNLIQAAEAKKKVDNFTLEDYNGVKHSLSDYKSSKGIVIIFIATQCPVSNAYNERMAELYKDYTSKGITFIGINSNKQETVEDIKEHASKNSLAFTILKDRNNLIADKIKASVTPEVYVLNSAFEILYHGRIDDSKKKENITSKDLRTALDEIISGKPVAVEETKAFGCSIKKVD